jgi:hypothetical protein
MHTSCPAGADHLLGRDPVHPLRVEAHKSAPVTDVGLEAVVTQIPQDFLHRLIRQLGVEPVQARILGGRARAGAPKNGTWL